MNPLTVGLLVQAVRAIAWVVAGLFAVSIVKVVQRVPKESIRDVSAATRTASYALLVLAAGYLLSQTRGLRGPLGLRRS